MPLGILYFFLLLPKTNNKTVLTRTIQTTAKTAIIIAPLDHDTAGGLINFMISNFFKYSSILNRIK